MKAGRELDALVAEKVMGWTYKTFPKGKMPYVKHWYCGEQYMLMQPFSTSIADAWLVFTKFTSRYVWFDDATDTWHCHLDSTRRTMEDCRHHATSEDEAGCEAICFAALKAVGVEVKE